MLPLGTRPQSLASLSIRRAPVRVVFASPRHIVGCRDRAARYCRNRSRLSDYFAAQDDLRCGRALKTMHVDGRNGGEALFRFRRTTGLADGCVSSSETEFCIFTLPPARPAPADVSLAALSCAR